MPSKAQEFAQFVSDTLDKDPILYPAVLKEVIHIESLSAMNEAGLFQRMVFQGGTAIRLCYGGTRYSEDLDFSCTAELTEEHMSVFFDCLQDRIRNLGLVLEPFDSSMTKLTNNPSASRRWRTRIVIPSPTGSAYGIRNSHHVKVEVDHRPVHERTSRVAIVDHAELGQTGPVVATKSMQELLADKTLAFLGRNTMKWRDVFDMYFLRNRIPLVNNDLLRVKLGEDYSSVDRLIDRLNTRRKDLEKSRRTDLVSKELTPLLPIDQRDVWLSDDGVEALYVEAGSALTSIANLRGVDPDRTSQRDKSNDRQR